MQDFFSGGIFVDAVIGLTVLEGLALWAYHLKTGKGLPASEYALNVASGLCLMMALRSATLAPSLIPAALLLLLAGVFHATDLWRRWRHRQSLKPF